MTPNQPNDTFRPSWSEVWTLAVTKPQKETFSLLLTDPNAKPARALLWVYLVAIVSFLVLYGSLVNNPELQNALFASLDQADLPTDDLTQFLWAGGVIVSPFSGAFTVLGYVILGIVIQFVVDQMGVPERTRGKRALLLYCMGAIVAPLLLVSTLFNLVGIGFLGLGVTVYQTYLLILATQAIYEMDFRNALTAVALPTIFFLLLQVVLLQGMFA